MVRAVASPAVEVSTTFIMQINFVLCPAALPLYPLAFLMTFVLNTR